MECQQGFECCSSASEKFRSLCQGIGKDVPRSERTPSWEIPNYKPYITWVFMGYNPQESLENTINTMGPRKPTFLEVFDIFYGKYVRDFRWPKSLCFMVFGAHGRYIYIILYYIILYYIILYYIILYYIIYIYFSVLLLMGQQSG